MTVDIEQEISSRAGHERDLLHKIGRSRSSRKRWFVTCCSFVAATSGRHTGMSPATANTPPSQFLPSADIPVAVPPRTRPR
jgi:hypothetical protein